MRRSHSEALEILLTHPQNMGMTGGRMIICKEPRFMDAGRIQAEPDFMILQGDLCTLVEYKSTHLPVALDKAREQLSRAEDYLAHIGFKYDKIRKIYVPGDSSPQVIE